jgi:hypothetical protein
MVDLKTDVYWSLVEEYYFIYLVQLVENNCFLKFLSRFKDKK